MMDDHVYGNILLVLTVPDKRLAKEKAGTIVVWIFMDTLAEIEGYSLLDKHAGNVFSMHPLVHSWCLTTLENEHSA
jgi:hypothetical protein